MSPRATSWAVALVVAALAHAGVLALPVPPRSEAEPPERIALTLASAPTDARDRPEPAQATPPAEVEPPTPSRPSTVAAPMTPTDPPRPQAPTPPATPPASPAAPDRMSKAKAQAEDAASLDPTSLDPTAATEDSEPGVPAPSPAPSATMAAPTDVTGLLPAPSAPLPGPSGPAGSNAPAADAAHAYALRVRALVERHKRYPERARRRRLSGVVTLELLVAPSGALQEPPRVTRSSGVAALDREARRMATSAAPFPATGGHRPLSISVPVRFSVRELDRR